jgi:hypothetical protein
MVVPVLLLLMMVVVLFLSFVEPLLQTVMMRMKTKVVAV